MHVGPGHIKTANRNYSLSSILIHLLQGIVFEAIPTFRKKKVRESKKRKKPDPLNMTVREL